MAAVSDTRTEALDAAPVERGALLNGFIRYLPLLILAAIWELASRSGLVSQLALPSLTSVIVAWFDLLRSGDLVWNGSIRCGGSPPASAWPSRSAL